MTDTPTPAVGQIWQDNDKRSYGRRVRIVEIDATHATVELTVTRGAGHQMAKPGRRTRIRLDRFPADQHRLPVHRPLLTRPLAAPRTGRPPPSTETTMTNLATETPPTLGVLGGDCLCGRGPAIGTCIATASRIWFRAFHDGSAAYHLERVLDWACVDCVADTALAVASGEVREAMRRIAREKREAQP